MTAQSKASLLADEDVHADIVRRLAAKGHDMITVRQQDANKRGSGWSDEHVLDLAISQDRAVLTQNVAHFKELVSNRPYHCGIVAIDVPEKDKTKELANEIDRMIGEELSQNNQSLIQSWVRVRRPDKPLPKQKKN